jgi:ABC-type lipoprotein release transport system permease subunit
MLFKLAWKNIWRNKKRTVIVSASIFFGVFFSSMMRSGQVGSFDYIIYSLAHMHLGYLQIQHPEFMEKRSLDNAIIADPVKLNQISKLAEVSAASYRIETFALLSKDTLTHVAQTIGIDPLQENKLTALQERIVKGEFLKPGDKGVLIGDALAEKLQVGAGDTLILFGSGYHGISAAALLEIQGILHFPIAVMNKTLLYMDMQQAQYIYSLPQMATNLVINLDNIEDLPAAFSKIQSHKGETETLLTWEELMPEIRQSMAMKYGSSYIMIGILYMVIGFGIFGVVMMMTLEREKEYGILNGLGMKKTKMVTVSILENLFMVSIGVLAGMLVSVPLLVFMAHNPIPITGAAAKSSEQLGIEPLLTFSDSADIFIYQGLIVFSIALVCSLYSLFFLSKLNVVNALKK